MAVSAQGMSKKQRKNTRKNKSSSEYLSETPERKPVFSENDWAFQHDSFLVHKVKKPSCGRKSMCWTTEQKRLAFLQSKFKATPL
ncbi:hypothetical protein TNCV_348651 [Trichonephila clavipes]|nr:hypothetical protein TNCV_348651 [Trichonephila clavipes]